MTKGGMETVEVFTSEGKGRALKAVREFLSGEVIFAEPAYAAVVFDSLTHLICHTCFKRQEKLHRCGQCKFAHYCDRTCQRGAWLNHKNECSAIKKHGKAPNENIRLAARIMWRIEREGGGLTEGSLVSIDDLQNHVENFGEEEKKELRADVESFIEFWPPQSQQFGMQYISHIFGVINCNGFTLSDQRGLQAVGVGVFPNLCLVNHDCWPNCTVIFNNGNHEAVRSMFHTQMRIELRALGKISPGEELTVSYIDFLNVSEDRRKQLKKQYYFDCTCEHCQKKIKDDLMLAVKEGEHKPSQDMVKEVIQFSKDTLEKINKARSEGVYHEVVKLCRECLKKQEPVLGDTNIYLLRILSIVSEVLSYLQMFEEAADHAKRMVDGYMKIYHPNNAQLGMAMMRAGVTHWHAGLIEAGHGMICKAYAILLVTHGPTHPITKDLEVMRVQTEMELRMFQQNEFMYYKMREAALSNQKIQVMPEPSTEASQDLFVKKQ
ncbi:PREDICTED: histone-lysine N-methyltransferase SMYD1 isoform X1 [Gavialis gangeticus]|uniref:histone-lysine N-methyltransferase SMYD1 isoform X1 n=1 Tax=Gavialis gangeticus TaxID=94835 RepID=UPI00092E847B|nr:PREDICTED: histone-lysine N-methyltransferase SMYD1 isoform X1 [Gavialis gangeticus]